MSQIEEKQKILASFLKNCRKSKIDGELLAKISKDCGIDESKINLLFEDGIVGIVDFHILGTLEELEEIVAENKNFYQDKIRSKIYFCLLNFFKVQQSNRKSLAQVRDFYLDPKNLLDKDNGLTPISFAMKSSCKIADRIWNILGDKSTDYNYYTKRLTLAKIIVKSFSAFVKDETKELDLTAKVIAKEIEKVMQFEKFKRSFSGAAKASKESVTQMIFDENCKMKPINEIVKNLPFIRLFN